MADKPETKTKREEIEPIDFAKVPVFLTMRQTKTRNVIIPVMGDPAAEDKGRAKVEDMAKDEAKRLGCNVAVFGPQVAVYAPPEPAEPRLVGFDFGD